ncbi:MAG: endonuclease III [Deltaproteobacteria bacterium]|nr:endonuclease III [Deltaproteobacteria bacterium]
MTDKDLPAVFKVLRSEFKRFKIPAVTVVSVSTRDPYMVLVSCIISLRTKDEVTADASRRLFERAKTVEAMVELSEAKIAELIYPAGFYKTKSKTILEASKVILKDYDGIVPNDVDELTKLKGVGRKTANLVVTLGYGKPGICVDTHVHRITNHWGYVNTPTPDKTEVALREKLPKKYWIPINDLLVAYGQNLCKPVSPFCSECKIYEYCERVGVGRSR